MATSQKILAIVFATTFGGLLLLTAVADNNARAYNNPDGGNGDGFNPIISPGEYTPPNYLPWLFPPNAHIALARQAATDGKMDAAKQHALNALQANPASGEAVLGLFDFYTRPSLYKIEPPIATQEYEKGVEINLPEPTEPPPQPSFAVLSRKNKLIAENLASIANTLRPTYATTQYSLSNYWLDQGKPEKSLYGWHVLLLQVPEAAPEIFPLIQANMRNPHLQQALQSYRSPPATWWIAFQQYQQKHQKLPAQP